MFTFKQFSVDDALTAMKVGTDGVLLGAWAAGGKRILDIGTGSGLIALMMAQRFPEAEIVGIDIDEDACRQARMNADSSPFGNRITIVHASLQDYVKTIPGASFDSIVSNPPYVCDFEKRQMRANVLDWEPAVALFVPDDNPLLFYEAITDMAVSALSDGGSLYFEINPLFVQEMEQMLVSKGMVDVVVNESQQYNNRMMRAMKPLD